MSCRKDDGKSFHTRGPANNKASVTETLLRVRRCTWNDPGLPSDADHSRRRPLSVVTVLNFLKSSTTFSF